MIWLIRMVLTHVALMGSLLFNTSLAFQDGFAEEHAIFGGYNQSAGTSGEQGTGNLRLLDNFTLYVQTDDEGSEELVDLQDFSVGKWAQGNAGPKQASASYT